MSLFSESEANEHVNDIQHRSNEAVLDQLEAETGKKFDTIPKDFGKKSSGHSGGHSSEQASSSGNTQLIFAFWFLN